MRPSGRFGASLACALGAWLAFGQPTAHAELTEIRLRASGMECPECSRSLRLALARLDGVRELETSWNRRMAFVALARGNHTTLDDVRAIVVAHHFVPQGADVVAYGTIEAGPHGLIFNVTGGHAAYAIVGAPADLAVGAVVKIAGFIGAAASGAPEQIVVHAIETASMPPSDPPR